MVEAYYLSIYWANFHGFRYESLHQRQAATQQVQADPVRRSLDGYDMLILWLVVWNMFFTFLYVLGMSPSQLTHLFQRGRSTTNQHLNADASTYRIFGIHKLLHTEAFTQRRFFIETPLRADSFYTEKLTHTHKSL